MEHRTDSHLLPHLSDTQAAKYLGLSVSTLRRWRCERRGNGPKWYKLGGRVKYSRADLDEYILDCQRNARG